MLASRASPRPWRAIGGGFTLIELIVVLAIISLLLAVALPNTSQPLGGHALAATARDIAAALRLTRDRAVAENRILQFVTGKMAFGPGGRGPLHELPKGMSLTLLGEDSTSAVEPIRFYPDGSSTGGGIALAAGRARYVVVVNWITGDVSIRPQAAQPDR